MVSLNEKCSILISIAQKQTKEVEKEIPLMYRGMVKSLLMTIGMLAAITPESKIRSLFEKLHMLYETVIVCEHQTTQEFKEHVEDLLKAWI